MIGSGALIHGRAPGAVGVTLRVAKLEGPMLRDPYDGRG